MTAAWNRLRQIPHLSLLLGGLAVCAGLALAIAFTWTSDDAFISFRYAHNLVDGHGLVFNPGERVEGFTNFLWTLHIALGLAVGVDAEVWTHISSITAWTGTLLLLAFVISPRLQEDLSPDRANDASPLERKGTLYAMPFAAILAASSPEMAVFATSGLETSLFTFFLVAGFAVLTREATVSIRTAAAAGVIFGLASITRPDGTVLAAVAGLYVVCCSVRRLRATIAIAVSTQLIWLPVQIFRMAYYGHFFPNTYYAKSASISWWSQGIHYLTLYLEKYWVLILMIPVAAVLLVRSRNSSSDFFGARTRRTGLLAAAMTLSYVLYVTRVGGDFMYGRFLVPVTPLALVVVEIGVLGASRWKRWAPVALGTVLLVGWVATPHPIPGTGRKGGVVNEWALYNTPLEGYDNLTTAEYVERAGKAHAGTFADLDVRVVFFGAEARWIYFTDVVAIDGFGLTDTHIARLPLEERGVPGHEKRPDAAYLLDERAAHLSFSPHIGEVVDPHIPEVVAIVNGDPARVLTWDPELMAALAERGVDVPDFLGQVDAFIATLPERPDSQVRDIYRRLKRFYFQHHDDPVRERAFRQRLDMDDGQDGGLGVP